MFSALLALPMALAATPAPSTGDIQLQASYIHEGVKVCDFERVVKSGVSYLWCDGKLLDGSRLLVKLNAQRESSKSIRVASQIERIDTDGRFLNVGRLEILTLPGESASIESGADGANVKLEVLARNKN